MQCRHTAAAVLSLMAWVFCSEIGASDTPDFDDLLSPGGLWLTYDPASGSAPLLDSFHETNASRADVRRGRSLYHSDWSTTRREGRAVIGPDFDATSCAACHMETAAPGVRAALPWIARPVIAQHLARYGTQLSTRRHGGEMPEAKLTVQHETQLFQYPDGEVKRLRRPIATAQVAGHQAVPAALRTAPLLFGWGLIEAADRKMLSHFHDPEDSNNDGISGRMITIDGEMAFLGWKNTETSLRSQTTAALENDMGIYSASDEGGEIDPWAVSAMASYVTELGVPERRSNADFWSGQALFGQAGCASCHVPALITQTHSDPRFSKQLIWPYSDLMLHDMGPDLADAGDDPMAAEWRTAPLWGLGVVEERLPNRGFLHDGRAKDLEEAILWHGGEARASRSYFVELSKPDRAGLLKFVRSL